VTSYWGKPHRTDGRMCNRKMHPDAHEESGRAVRTLRERGRRPTGPAAGTKIHKIVHGWLLHLAHGIVHPVSEFIYTTNTKGCGLATTSPIWVAVSMPAFLNLVMSCSASAQGVERRSPPEV
jgi:hypothetical protein